PWRLVGQKHPARPSDLEALAVRQVRALPFPPAAQQVPFPLERLVGLVRLWFLVVLEDLARRSRLAGPAVPARLSHPRALAGPAGPARPLGLAVREVRTLPFPLAARAAPVRLFRLAVPESLRGLPDPEDRSIRRAGRLRQEQSLRLIGASFPPAIFLAASVLRKKHHVNRSAWAQSPATG